MTSEDPARAASQTAIGVAMLRAAHQFIDDPPKILEDAIAVRLLLPEALARMRAEPERLQTPGARALRAHVILRSRFAEDCLALAAERGVTQYVLLGAGFDTFAYRQPSWAAAVRIFEVDQPASQQLKRDTIARAGVHVPSNVVYVAVDFAVDSIGERLAKSGFDPMRPAFISWLGVTMYLPEPAIDVVLEFVAALPKSTEIVLTFAQPPDQASASRIAERAAEVGEPWLTYFAPARLEQKLRHSGFSHVSFLTPAESSARYFSGRTDGLQGPRRTSIVRATV